jgi:hypothetical protein
MYINCSIKSLFCNDEYHMYKLIVMNTPSIQVTERATWYAKVPKIQVRGSIPGEKYPHTFQINAISRVARFLLVKNTKTGKNFPNYQKLHIPNVHKMQ